MASSASDGVSIAGFFAEIRALSNCVIGGGGEGAFRVQGRQG